MSRVALLDKLQQRIRRYQVAARLLALLLLIALTVLIAWLLRHGFFQVMGYPGVFLSSFLSSATVVVPAPGMAVTMAMGGVLNPFLVGLLASLGDTLGETTGYLAGAGGQVVIPDNERYRQIQGLMSRYGPVVLFLLALVPNPFFDLAGISAGALRYPLLRFFLWTWVGKLGKGLFIAYMGAEMARMLAPYFP